MIYEICLVPAVTFELLNISITLFQREKKFYNYFVRVLSQRKSPIARLPPHTRQLLHFLIQSA